MSDRTDITRRAADTYFSSWQARDFDAFTALLADDVDFVGAMGAVQGVEQCVGGLRGVRDMVDGIDVVKRWVDGADAITWFELRREGKDAVPTVNWSHVGSDGRIDRIRVTFDVRRLLGS
ncbi:nuclear transport factor 2 family protein [Jatrophihabitans fulvus]